jgi:hypothetical protein
MNKKDEKEGKEKGKGGRVGSPGQPVKKNHGQFDFLRQKFWYMGKKNRAMGR